MRPPLRDERGITLIEVLVTASIGLVVLVAAMTFLVAAQNSTQKISARVEATQKARTELEQMTQQLRAMVCPPVGSAPIVSATPQQVTFYSDLNGNTVQEQEQRRLRVSSVAGQPTSIIEERWVAVPTTSAPDRQRVVASDVEPARDAAGNALPYFSFHAYPDGRASGTVALAAVPALATVDASRVARIDVAFRTRPSTAARGRNYLDISGSAYARTLDRSDPDTSPTYSCA